MREQQFKTLISFQEVLLLSNFDFALCANFAVKLLRFVGHCHGQLFLVTVKVKIIRYTPRVPARARSAKGHYTFGDDFAVGASYNDIRIQRLILFYSLNYFTFCIFVLFINFY